MRLISSILFTAVGLSAAEYSSHPPMRPLPGPSVRPEPTADVYFVNGLSGSDDAPGTRTQPWRTIGRGVAQLKAGDTLMLAGGVYHEHVRITAWGSADQPITIRPAKGEIAIIDGGIPEFFHRPAASWIPLGNGEFQSVKAYPGIPVRKDSANLLGNFADSMIPLHGHRFDTDLRSNNHKFQNLAGPKTLRGTGLYCGPGVFLNPESRRIHIRLAHTRQPSIGESNNYRGETDPRELRLVIAGGGRSPLELDGAAHVVVQDLVVRGARAATLNLVDCANITLDGVTSYGGSSALRVESTSGLRCINSRFRGIAAPWLWRWSLKYRSIEARIVSASSWNPPARSNRDFEFANCEFTDSVDGVFVGNVDGAELHHSRLDNVSDDGFFITCRTAYDGTTTGISSFHHNHISRVLTAFAYGVGHGRQKTINAAGHKQLGKTVHIHHNHFDLRDPVLYQQPVQGPITTFGRVAGDHGSPAWEPMVFEHNTVLMKNAPWRNYYAAGWAKAMGKGTRRVIRHNIFVHDNGMPGDLLPKPGADFVAEHNIHWSRENGKAGRELFMKRFRSSPMFPQTGWTKGDRYEDPGRIEPPLLRQASIQPFVHPAYQPRDRKAAMVLGYPAFDAPLFQFALEKAGVRVDVFEREWLSVPEYRNYGLVAFFGNTVRAQMTKTGFAPEEHPTVREYLQRGGRILIGRELPRFLFPEASGRAFLQSLTGKGPERTKPTHRILRPDHPWIAHLNTQRWSTPPASSPIIAGDEFNIIGDPAAKRSLLTHIPVANGSLTYVGWEISRFLPHGRKPSTVDQEAAYEEQYQIYENVVSDLLR